MKPGRILLMAGAGTFTRTITVPGGGAVNLRTLANTAGYNGSRPVDLTFNLPSGATISAGLDQGAWPAGVSLKFVLNVAGSIYGAAGIGGVGIAGSFGTAGGAGGDAVNCTKDMTINVAAGGEIKSGGGGGGGGGGWSETVGPPGETETTTGIGGDGGTGFPNQTAGSAAPDFAAGAGGYGGAAATVGASGANATHTGVARNGGAGGAAGAAIRKNGHTVVVNNLGTIVGTQV